MDKRRKGNEAARQRRIAQRQDPNFQPKRNWDDQGNRLYHGLMGEFMAQNPQYIGKRFQNPKNEGLGPFTEAGMAYHNFYNQKRPNRYTKTKPPKRFSRQRLRNKESRSRMAGDIFNRDFQPGPARGNDVRDIRGTNDPRNDKSGMQRRHW